MTLPTLRIGSEGPHVELVQAFLRGRGAMLVVDGDYGIKTADCVRVLQDEQGQCPDGVVGPRTWGVLLALGLPAIESDDVTELGPNWPPKPAGMAELTAAQRMQIFGSFTHEADPVPSNPEQIKIVTRTPEFRIAHVEIPELMGKKGAPANHKVFFHAKGAAQLQLLFRAWNEAGLLHHVLTWDGSYVPRFVRGSRVNLSPHAHGTAFDINAAWNPLGAEPALKGRRGSVRELVEIARGHQFYWGGWFGRPDGMHFSLVGIT